MLSASSEALMIGHCCSAMMAARTKNGMNVRRTPWRCSKPAFCLLRRPTMRLKSTSYMQWTWALVRRDSIMRWAIILRIFVMGTRSPGYGAGAEGAAGRTSAEAEAVELAAAAPEVAGGGGRGAGEGGGWRVCLW